MSWWQWGQIWLQKQNRGSSLRFMLGGGTIGPTLKVMDKNQWEDGKRLSICVWFGAFFFSCIDWDLLNYIRWYVVSNWVAFHCWAEVCLGQRTCLGRGRKETGWSGGYVPLLERQLGHLRPPLHGRPSCHLVHLLTSAPNLLQS